MGKLTLREIRRSLGRFLASAAIVALGVGFFCGLRLTKTAMVRTLDAYAEAQQKTITLTRAASDPQRMPTDDQEEQNRLLQTVMEKESPVGLFTAEEIAEIRNGLAIPDEFEP